MSDLVFIGFGVDFLADHLKLKGYLHLLLEIFEGKIGKLGHITLMRIYVRNEWDVSHHLKCIDMS